MSKKPTIVVDFDGTIVDHEFPGIGKLKRGVKEALTRLNEHFEIYISSCRNNMFAMGGSDGYYSAMKEFLETEGLGFCKLDVGISGKIVATAYIDDRGIRFEDNWEMIADYLCGVVR